MGHHPLSDPGRIEPEVLLRRFEEPDEIRVFENGRFEIVRIRGMVVGRACYEPGWKWSLHVGPQVGAKLCAVEHLGLVLEGSAVAAFENGRVVELATGQLFHIPAVPHDSWVIGDRPYVSLHFLGADQYARD